MTRGHRFILFLPLLPMLAVQLEPGSSWLLIAVLCMCEEAARFSMHPGSPILLDPKRQTVMWQMGTQRQADTLQVSGVAERASNPGHFIPCPGLLLPYCSVFLMKN